MSASPIACGHTMYGLDRLFGAQQTLHSVASCIHIDKHEHEAIGSECSKITQRKLGGARD